MKDFDEIKQALQIALVYCNSASRADQISLCKLQIRDDIKPAVQRALSILSLFTRETFPESKYDFEMPQCHLWAESRKELIELMELHLEMLKQGKPDIIVAYSSFLKTNFEPVNEPTQFTKAFRNVIQAVDPIENSPITKDNKDIKVLADWGRHACLVLEKMEKEKNG